LLVVCLAHPEAAGRVFNGIDDGLVTLMDFLGAYMNMIPTSRALRVPGGTLSFLAHLVDPFSRDLKVSYVVDQMRGCGQIRNDAAHSLGWEPRISRDEGLKRSEEWLRAEGLI
jgi:nucleoside-diphosphate-sugar epimerase